MLRKLLYTALVMLFLPAAVLAQGSITGTVTDAQTGETLPGANVVLQELQRGTATDANGQFTISNVPEGTYTLAVTFVGYKEFTTSVQVGSGETVVNPEVEPDYFGLEEVVVTGVGSGTQTKKLGFSVEKVTSEDLESVPALDPANALRGQMPGVSIVSASGNPADAPAIRLRGTTTITGDSSPLIIVDGVITSGSLRDINMEDVASMEVVKGAAAASIYGSLAGNGVIQITTKRNADKAGEPQVTLRSEYGFSQLAKDYPVATKHPFQTQGIELTDNGKYVETWPNAKSFDSDRRFDNEFPVLYNNVEAIYTGQPFNSNYVALANTGEKYNYRASYQGLDQGGIIKSADDYKRTNVRLNADYTPNDKLNAKFSASYVKTDAPRFTEQGQGNYFYSALTAMPYMDMTEKNENGNYAAVPTGYYIQDSNWQNPLYTAEKRTYAFSRDRIIAGGHIQYNVTDNLSVNARQSLDKTYRTNTEFYPKGFRTSSPTATETKGLEERESITRSTAVSEIWAQYNREFDEFNLGATAKFLHEDRKYESFSSYGYGYPVPGIRDMSALMQSSYQIDSYQRRIKATNYFLNVDLDYQDKIIASGLIRRDGSSLFGVDARWNTYYRGSLAYRITEDLDLPNINEWKIRASYGTSGNRPPFEAQYETFSASQSGISPDILGNTEIKPSTIAELEVGTDITFLERFNLTVNYAETATKNDYLLVPLASYAGYTAQWRNVGEIKSNTWEASLSGQLVNTQDFSWMANVNWSTTYQEVTDLGPVPPYTRSVGAAVELFRIEEGVSFGSMYGNKVLTSLDQLTVVNGQVMNNGIDTNGDGSLTVDDYQINSQGYVVPAGTHGTSDEQVVYAVDEKGEVVNKKIGDTQPDFTAGLANTFNYKGLSLYVLFDWMQGADVYNYTKQLLYFNYRHKEQQELATEGYDVGYTGSSSKIYNGGSASSYFVEDASFIKLRSLSLSYTFGSDVLGNLSEHIDEIKLSVTGDNLFTWTDYTGFDPEVALNTNSTNFRVDEYSYPNFRTFTGSIQVKF